MKLPPHIVVKLGGSLLHVPDLGERLRRWLATQPPALLIVGGGAAVDAIRTLDERFQIGDEHAHWLAVQIMGLNSVALAQQLRGARMASDLHSCADAWKNGITPSLDPLRFMQEDESRPDHLPHNWNVTSDSIAARVAVVSGAAELVLLKSVDAPHGASWEELAKVGVVDAWFPHAVESIPVVRVVNFLAVP